MKDRGRFQWAFHNHPPRASHLRAVSQPVACILMNPPFKFTAYGAAWKQVLQVTESPSQTHSRFLSKAVGTKQLNKQSKNKFSFTAIRAINRVTVKADLRKSNCPVEAKLLSAKYNWTIQAKFISKNRVLSDWSQKGFFSNYWLGSKSGRSRTTSATHYIDCVLANRYKCKRFFQRGLFPIGW